MTNRHHSHHPPTTVKPNTEVNGKPETYTPPADKAAAPPRPNPNPSLGPVGLAMKPQSHISSKNDGADCDEAADDGGDEECEDEN